MDYSQFIQGKNRVVPSYGFEVSLDEINKSAFEWQGRIIQWSLRRGRSAIFASPGLGKTLMQLDWSQLCHYHTGKPVVIHTPVGIRKQTAFEASKFGIDCKVAVVDEPSGIVDGINLINYEKLHKFDPSIFGSVALDESGVLKSLNGKTKQQLCDAYKNTPYRLACTATPAPNDHMELGSHAEFLGICEPVDMLNRYFYHDSGETSKWTLMPHARKDFWRWVSSWAICIDKPSNIQGSDDGYDLPPLTINRHIVESEQADAMPGYLFATAGISATTLHEEKRMTNQIRCEKAVELARSKPGPCVIWVDTNYEADLIKKLMPEAIEVRGNDSDKRKEQVVQDFSEGKIEYLISKASIFGFGANFQVCNRTILAGLNYSFESLYQLIRRFYRFGQTRPVTVDIVIADSESAIESSIARKETDFAVMQSGMFEAMAEGIRENLCGDAPKIPYIATKPIVLPSFLTMNESVSV